MKKPRARLERRNTPVPEPTPVDRLQPLWLASLTALIVATPLLPSETVQFGGSIMALILLWMLVLLAWALAGVAAGSLAFRGGPTLWVFVALLGWHTLSAVLMGRQGQPRAAFNMASQWVSLGLAFFLTRQLVRAPRQQRALAALMMGLAVSISIVGFYQYFYELPAARAEYKKDPEKMLRDAGIMATPGSVALTAFEKRLESVEPYATFALTNSLAGFLAPWLTVALGILVANWSSLSTRTRLVAGLTLVVMAGCLTLTKSRSAFVAVGCGVVLLIVYGRRSGWRPDWRWLTGGAAIALLLPALAYVVGGLDSFVFSQASKALLYRFQYWYSTWLLIVDFPWFGCGPGNFQQYYTAYKLPEASETVADPHNFLFEIWATAGTPAMVLFVTFIFLVAWRVWRSRRNASSAMAVGPTGELQQNSSTRGAWRATADAPAHDDRVGWIYAGGAAGAPFGYVACLFLEYPPSMGLLLLGFPIGAAVVYLWRDWVDHGHWPIAVPAVAIVVLMINLLGAGGIGFSGVAGTLWILVALLLNAADKMPAVRLSRGAAVAISAGALATLATFTQLGYKPQLELRNWLLEGEILAKMGRPLAMTAFRQAAEADKLSSQGWESFASMALMAWLETGDSHHEKTFRRATSEMLAVNRRSSAAYSQVGEWWLTAYRRMGKRECLDEAVAAYRVATQLYPNYNLGHAQLAWALHLAGAQDEARREAEEALRLDALNPHQEQNLARQRLVDSGGNHADQPASPGDRSAEQVMSELRTG